MIGTDWVRLEVIESRKASPNQNCSFSQNNWRATDSAGALDSEALGFIVWKRVQTLRMEDYTCRLVLSQSPSWYGDFLPKDSSGFISQLSCQEFLSQSEAFPSLTLHARHLRESFSCLQNSSNGQCSSPILCPENCSCFMLLKYWLSSLGPGKTLEVESLCSLSWSATLKFFAINQNWHLLLPLNITL